VATLEITRSILPLVYKTIAVGAVSALLSIFLFLIFRIYPPRSVRQAYQAILKNDRRLRRAEQVANLGNLEYIVSSDIVRASDGAARIIGLQGKEWKMADIRKIVLPEYHDEFNAAIKDMIDNFGHSRVKLKIMRPDNGRIIDIQAFAEYDSRNGIIFGVVQDITDISNTEEEKLKLEAQLLQSQKMETIGQLAGGIAHDFNNILTAIAGFGFLLKMQMQDNPAAAHKVNQILDATDRAAALTQSLLTFSRKQISNPRPIDINETIRATEKMLATMTGEHISIVLNLTDRKTPALADSNQIVQVLMNLAVNARDSMPEGGTLTIETEKVCIDDLLLKMHEYDGACNYILISFSDTGTGMEEQTRQKIFEPFFTTKDIGKGTGLGLSIVYGIVKQHKGFIDVQSEPGAGSTFQIYLPELEMEIEKPEPDAPFEYEHFTETILIADDEQTLRQALSGMLQTFGFKVIEADSGHDAVEKFREMKDSIDLLLLDVVMPGKRGVEAYGEIFEIRSDIKVIFISGYSDDHLSGRVISDSNAHFIFKPISPKKLFDKIKSVLQAGVK